jgi:hypothetical protein
MKLRQERKEKLENLKVINRKWYTMNNGMMKTMRIIGLVTFVLFLALFKGCIDYTTPNRTEVIVLDKLQSAGKYKSNFYLILKDTNGRVFDEVVSAADYSQCEKGKSYYMNIREMDIKQTPMKNTFFFILPCVLFCIWIVVLPSSFINFDNWDI